MKLRLAVASGTGIQQHDNLPFVCRHESGATGYITKSSEPESMVKAVRSVVAGIQSSVPDVALKMELAAHSTIVAATLGLGTRIRNLPLVAGAKTHEEIAGLLNIASRRLPTITR